ncbi:hypothetical protein NDU88_003700 [Pleurodeles waltl]|uniref:Uncharacterized protein n=1 Tax=Pleurodeles waltl TaxID=8319 RepID=A0AAV7NHD8_PLEWA|nr:hypothetical protein NDU88_003700 [Pleurodeles waltl]
MYSQGGSHRWHHVGESSQSGILVGAFFLKDAFKVLLIGRQNRSDPLRPHASSAVRAGGTALRRDFPDFQADSSRGPTERVGSGGRGSESRPRGAFKIRGRARLRLRAGTGPQKGV